MIRALAILTLASEDRITQIVIAGDAETVSRLMEELPQEVRGMVVEGPTLARDAGARNLSSTIGKIREDAVKCDGEKVARLLEGYRARGLAVFGPEATL